MVELSEEQVLSTSRASNLESVINLNCWGCELTDVTIFQNLANIEVINASANNLSSLKDFNKCKNLRELYLRENNISDLTELCHLKELKNLELLSISNNPVCQDDDYRMTVLKILPQLTTLDNILVTEEEILDAQEKGKDLKLSMTEESLESQNSSPQIESKERSLPPNPSIKISMDETNQLREELGLKPVTINCTTTIHTPPTPSNNILRASLALVEELDLESLIILQSTIDEKVQEQTMKMTKISANEKPAISVKDRVKKIIDLS